MYKNIAIVVLCLGFLVGCGDKESPTVMAKPEAGQGNANKVEKTKSETAIYLPGGAGIDFGVKPESDVTGTDAGGDYRLITYIIQSRYEDIDKALSDILTGQGYVLTQRSVNPNYQLVLMYKKPGANQILIRFGNKIVKEGFTTLTPVKISWSLN